MIPGKHVSLRPVEEGDYPFIHRWMNHPEVWRYMDYERLVSLADVKEDVERSYREGRPFTIVLEDQPIGRIGLNQFRRRDRICSLYMYIGEPDALGKKCGFVREAVLRGRSWKQGQWVDHVVMSVNREGLAKAREAWDASIASVG